jgi:hypothetical protein
MWVMSAVKPHVYLLFARYDRVLVMLSLPEYSICLITGWTTVTFLFLSFFPSLYLTKYFSGYQTWSVTLREEHRLRVFENRVLRRIFGRKRDEVIGEWRRLHNEELNDLY